MQKSKPHCQIARSMPYSVNIGFIAKIGNSEDIDMVFYVVAHEIAHQYLAHQLIGTENAGTNLRVGDFRAVFCTYGNGKRVWQECIEEIS